MSRLPHIKMLPRSGVTLSFIVFSADRMNASVVVIDGAELALTKKSPIRLLAERLTTRAPQYQYDH